MEDVDADGVDDEGKTKKGNFDWSSSLVLQEEKKSVFQSEIAFLLRVQGA